MGFIEFHQGCHHEPGCFGPTNDFYTIFGTQTEFLVGHLIVAIIIGIFIFGILFYFNKKRKLKIPLFSMYLFPIFLIIFLFFLLAYLFPVIVVY